MYKNINHKTSTIGIFAIILSLIAFASAMTQRTTTAKVWIAAKNTGKYTLYFAGPVLALILLYVIGFIINKYRIKANLFDKNDVLKEMSRARIVNKSRFSKTSDVQKKFSALENDVKQLTLSLANNLPVKFLIKVQAAVTVFVIVIAAIYSGYYAA